jgi:hypothetical protein
MRKGTARSFSIAGMVLIVLSVVLYTALELSSRWEQARSPGEKNLGISVLFIMFGIPMLISGAGGIFCLLVGALAFTYRRFFQRISN